MRKYLHTALFILAAALLVPACNKAEIEGQPSGGEKVTIRASVPSTKITLTPDGDGLHLAWEAGDCLRVISGSSSEVFDIKDGFTDHDAEFTGNKVSGSSFDIMYPGTFASVAAAESADFSSQVQHGNGNTAHLRYAALLSGVDTYGDIAFTEQWASEHGGTIKKAGAVKLAVTLPDNVTSVSRVEMALAGHKLSLGLEDVDVSADNQLLTAYLMTPWEDIELPAGTNVEVKVTTADQSVYGTTLTISAAATMRAGRVSIFNVTQGLEEFLFAGGSGTSKDPWLIANSRHLENMMNLYKETPDPDSPFIWYFKQIADVSASGITWTPLNNTGFFRKGVYYNGNGKTISGLKCVNSSSAPVSYPSFAGVLYGTIKDLTFTDASIDGAGSKAGVVGGFLGTVVKPDGSTSVSLPGNCYRVTVKKSTVKGTSFIGGFAGQVGNIEDINDCHVLDCNIIQQNTKTNGSDMSTGGFVGSVRAVARFKDCTVKATVTATQGTLAKFGGFVGEVTYSSIKTTSFTNCKVLSGSKLTASNKTYVGGFVGFAGGSGSYKGCSVEADITNNAEFTGGFAGYATGCDYGASSFDDCSVKAKVYGCVHTGGFVGKADKNATFIDCIYNGSGKEISDSFSGSVMASGGFVGLAQGNSRFVDCTVLNATMLFYAGQRQGGFAGNTGDTPQFTRCGVEDSTIEGNQRVGGFVGQGANSNADAYLLCYVDNVDITGSTNTGGFVGVQYGTVSQCYVHGGRITAEGNNIGGFSGYPEKADIIDCWTDINISAGDHSYVGGMIGICKGNVHVNECYSCSSVTGSDVAAFVGRLDVATSEITSCIAWNGTHDFAGSIVDGGSIAGNYCGTEGTVSGHASTFGWDTSVWNLSGSLPVLAPGNRVGPPAVFIGDSITWQWTESGFYPEFFTDHGYVNKGISAQNTTEMRARFGADVVALSPKVTVIMGGTNDIAQGYTKEQIMENLRAMAEAADAAGIKVVLCSVTPCNNTYSSVGGPKTLAILPLNEAIKAYADSKGFPYCDYYPVLVDSEGGLRAEYRAKGGADALHPNREGYLAMAAVIQPIIESLL